MIFEKEFQDYGYTDIVGYSGKHITDDMLAQCVEIDNNFFEPEFIWNADNMKEMVSKFNQMCFVFVDKTINKVIGFSFWLPIKTKVFNAFIQNNIPLLEFRENFFSTYKEESVNLFLSSEAYVLGYDIKKLHKAVEDIFCKRLIDLAYLGTKVKYIAFESTCKFDEQFLAKKIGFTQSVKRKKTTFFYDEYSPDIIYSDSKYASGLKQLYKDLDEKDD